MAGRLEIRLTPLKSGGMSDTGRQSKAAREERLAAQLRANLRRRKQAARKVAPSPSETDLPQDHNPDKPLP